MLSAVALILFCGFTAVNAASKVFYESTSYSISSGSTKSTYPPVMRVPYNYAVAQLKVNSTTNGIQETVFTTYYQKDNKWNKAHTKLTALRPGAAYYENLGEMSESNLWKINNSAKYLETNRAGWSGELYYISSTSEM